MTYSYDPTKINEFGVDRMRFELGDVLVLEGAKTAYLSDSEYLAVLESSKSWRRAKFRLIETLLRRFSYETDTKVDSVEFKLSQRVDEWRREYNRLRTEVDAEDIAQSGALNTSNKSRPPAFWVGQHDWRQRHVFAS